MLDSIITADPTIATVMCYGSCSACCIKDKVTQIHAQLQLCD